jgi:hypothetical protein
MHQKGNDEAARDGRSQGNQDILGAHGNDSSYCLTTPGKQEGSGRDRNLGINVA